MKTQNLKLKNQNYGVPSARHYNNIPKGYISFTLLVLSFTLLWFSEVHALGGKAPEPPKEEPKYKLEILKMELIPTFTLTPEAKAKDLSTKKILMVIAPKNFQDQEFSKPKEILEVEGAKVTVASSITNTAVGMYGLKVKPDILTKNAKATDYDAIIFVGGSGALTKDTWNIALANEAAKHDKIVGAICVAPVILAEAGLLEGKKATVSPYGKDDLKEAGAIYTDKNVEIDGKIITGKGPAAAEEFGKAIVEELQTAAQ